jgi:hypothetical protein
MQNSCGSIGVARRSGSPFKFGPPSAATELAGKKALHSGNQKHASWKGGKEEAIGINHLLHSAFVRFGKGDTGSEILTPTEERNFCILIAVMKRTCSHTTCRTTRRRGVTKQNTIMKETLLNLHSYKLLQK